jgi:hypothetical protein
MVIFLPLAVSLWWSSRRSVVALASCLFSSRLGRSWRRSSASNATSGRRISMVLVWSLVSVARRSCSVLNDRSHLRRWAGRADTVWGRGTLASGLSWWAAESSWWRRGRRRNTTSVRAVVRVGDTVRLRCLLLLVYRWLWLRMSRLRCELRWLRVVRTGSNMVCLRRWGHATTHWCRWSGRWGTSWPLRTRTVCRRTRGLCVRPGCFLSGAYGPLRSMLCRWSDALALLIWVQLLWWKVRVTDLCQRAIPSRC